MAQYLHAKFDYVSVEAIQSGLDLLDQSHAEMYKQSLGDLIPVKFIQAINANDIDESFRLLVVVRNTKELYLEGSDSPLIEAIKKGNVVIVKLLLDKGADANAVRPDNPLELAMNSGNIEIIKLLIQHGAKVNKEFSSGFLPIMHAAVLQNVAIIQLLLKSGANVSQSFLENNYHRIEKRHGLELLDVWDEAYDFLMETLKNLKR